ncbi:MAG TPA: fatty acid desaturase, partial [Chroococcidiopsis sp.]
MQRQRVRIGAPALQNAAALGYAIAAYGLGVGLLIVNNGWLNGLGVLLLTHGLVMSAVLLHELLHGNLFKARSLNQFWGQVMTHLNGACYAPWEDLVNHHFNHHIHHADFVAFDSAAAVRSLPPAV